MDRKLTFLIPFVLLLSGCFGKLPVELSRTPTPTPLPPGSFAFEPERVASETRAVEVKIFTFSPKGVPVDHYSILLTEPPVVQDIVRMLLASASGGCQTSRPTPKPEVSYGVDLILYNRPDIIPSSPDSASAMLASIDFEPEGNYMGIYRLRGKAGEFAYEFCPVEPSLKELLQRELSRRGIALPVYFPSLTPTVQASPAFTPSPHPPMFPPPLPTREGTNLYFSAGCPNPEGVEAAVSLTKSEALEVINKFIAGDREQKLQVTDPSLWPLLPSTSEPSALKEKNLSEPRPAGESPYADLLANACGRGILDTSWWVEVCPGSPPPDNFEQCPHGLRMHYFFIRRRGRWLIWGNG